MQQLHMFFPVQRVAMQDALVVQAFFGVVAHLVFKRYEPERLPSVCILVVVIPTLLSGLLVTHLVFINAILVSFISYYASFLTSLLIYRVGPFHPLAKYPGPFLCKISMIRMAAIAYRGKRHEYIRTLHDKYGDVVRIGPNEVCIRDTSAIVPLMGQNGLPKGPMWLGRSMNQPVLPLIAQQTVADHQRRRKPWNRAFNSVSLKGYEPVVANRASQLVEILRGQVGIIDLSAWINYYVFDFMNDMAFGGGSELMRSGKDCEFRWLMDHSMQTTVVLETIPWLREMVGLVPGVARKLVAFRRLCFERATRRVQSGSTTKDLFYFLNNEDGAEKVSPPMSHVVSDAALAVVAGSDTTSGVLANVWFLLLRNPEAYAKLRAEVDLYYPPGEDACDTKHYPKMLYLDAVINETLRLYPANLSGSQRTPARGSGGAHIGPYFIPEGTAARVHTFSVHRDSRNFSPLTEAFWPDRWILAHEQTQLRNTKSTEKVALTHNTSAFIPFAVGPANCAGKNLAMLEMRMLVCCCVQQLEFELAGDLVYDPGRWESGLLDFFILQKGKLPVTVKSRT